MNNNFEGSSSKSNAKDEEINFDITPAIKKFE